MTLPRQLRPRAPYGLALVALASACASDPAAADGSTDGSDSGTADAGPSSGVTVASDTQSTNTQGSQSDTGTTTSSSETEADASTSMDTSAQTSADATDSDSDESSTTGDAAACGDDPEIPYQVAFATYLGGGDDWEHARDAVVAPNGDIVIVGGTASDDFPATNGAWDGSFGGGGNQTGGHGDSDVFVARFTADGDLIWATYLGGANYDRAYAVELDAAGDVVLAGRAGPGFPVTEGVFQPEYLGNDSGFYGVQNGFVAKLSGDGGSLLWSSLFGVGHLVRDFAVDDAGNVYAVMTFQPGSVVQQPSWLAAAVVGAYQPARANNAESGLAKISADGSSVMWATWLGSSGNESAPASIRVDAAGRPTIAMYTDSTDLPTTGSGVTTSHSGGDDVYVARLSSDGTTLEMGAYVGGSGDDAFETHALGIAGDDIYVGGFTSSDDFPVTPDATQGTFGGGTTDAWLARLSDDGTLVTATYVGGSGNDGADGVTVASNGEVLFTGETTSSDFPTTANAFQDQFGGNHDAFAVRFGADLSVLRYASYFGGPAYENGRGAVLADDCTAVIVGAVDGGGFPTVSPWQADFAGGPDQWGNGDAFAIVLR
jgi:hypothetical protein